MSYVKIHDGLVHKFPYTIGDLRRDNPRTSFPKRVSEPMLSQYGVFPVTYADEPAYNPLTHRIEIATQPTLSVDDWVLSWSTVPLTLSEIEARLNNVAKGVRASRNTLLSATDYFALTDVSMSAEMTTYRQALRDITSHASFPNLVEADWPTAP